MIVRNAARCRKCGDVIESKSLHDFQACSCGAIFVDGGHTYLRHGGWPEDFESLVETVPDEEVEKEENEKTLLSNHIVLQKLAKTLAKDILNLEQEVHTEDDWKIIAETPGALENDSDDLDEDGDEKYVLTPWGCLCVVMDDYNIDYSHLTPMMGKHMVEDFMDAMERAGHVSSVEA